MALMLCMFCLPACALPKRVTRKPIEQLYHEAVSTSASSRQAIFQTPTPPGSSFRNHVVQPISAQEKRMISTGGGKNLSKPAELPLSTRIRHPSMRRKDDGNKQSVSLPFADISKSPGLVHSASFDELLQESESEEQEVLRFNGNDLVEVITELAEAFKVQYFVDESVGGQVDGIFKATSFEQAMDRILKPYGYHYALREGTYYIGPADPKSDIFHLISTVEHYEPLHHPPETLIAMLPEKQRNFVRSAEKKNLLLIEAPKALSDEIANRFREVDVPVPQIQLEAIVCFISPDTGLRYGLDWNHTVKVEGQSSLSFGVSGLSFSGLATKNGYENAFSDFAVTSGFLKLLAQEGYLTLRAAPRVVARNGEKASISISRETYFSLQPTGTDLIFRQNVQTVNAGIKLDITPTIRGDTISINIEKAEVSEDVRTNDVRAELTSNPYPIINRREVTTTVNVKDGQTIVIGGLVQRQTVERVNRVVGLSDVPLLGSLFRTIEKQEQDVEVAIFISPRLVSEPSVEEIPCE